MDERTSDAANTGAPFSVPSTSSATANSWELVVVDLLGGGDSMIVSTVTEVRMTVRAGGMGTGSRAERVCGGGAAAVAVLREEPMSLE